MDGSLTLRNPSLPATCAWVRFSVFAFSTFNVEPIRRSAAGAVGWAARSLTRNSRNSAPAQCLGAGAFVDLQKLSLFDFGIDLRH